MRPLGLAGHRSLQARRALVSLASIAEWPVKNRCVSAPHADMHRRQRKSHGSRRLLRSGRVVGSREGGGSSAAIGLVLMRVQTWVALATANSQACEWAGDERRRKAEHGGVGTQHSRGAPGTGTVLGIGVGEVGSFVWCSRARRLVGSATRRLGCPSAHRPSGRDSGTGVTSQNRNSSPQAASLRGFVRRFCFAFSRVSRASQATLPYAGSSASPNLRAQLFRATPRGSAE